VIECPQCQHKNREDNLFCENCNFLLRPLPKSHLLVIAGELEPERWWESQAHDSHYHLRLRFSESGESIEVDPHPAGGIILGRLDSRTGLAPDVDLTPFGAEDAGVSRQHAVIAVTQEIPRLIDLNSHNHTYLNGLRLAPHLPYILRQGDVIRLSRLEMTITFVDPSEAEAEEDHTER
jgi:hypothetical protein